MANYVSKHTGAQIDAAVDKTGELDGKVAALTEEIVKVFPNEAKQLLIEILRSGVYNEDVAEKVTELAEIFGITEDIPETETVKLILAQGSTSYDANASVGASVASTFTARLTLLSETGENVLNNGYYLTQIPNGAKRVSITTPSDFNAGVLIFPLNGEKYGNPHDSGWLTTGTPYSYNISSYANGNWYIAVNFKATDGRDLLPEQYADSISLEFLYT